MSDKITGRLLEDGRIVTETDSVSSKNHSSADQFYRAIVRLGGGATEVTKLPHTHSHHTHTHTHTQDESHSH